MVKKLAYGTLTTAALILQPLAAELVLLVIRSPLQSVSETIIGLAAIVTAGGVVAAVARWCTVVRKRAVAACAQDHHDRTIDEPMERCGPSQAVERHDAHA